MLSMMCGPLLPLLFPAKKNEPWTLADVGPNDTETREPFEYVMMIEALKSALTVPVICAGAAVKSCQPRTGPEKFGWHRPFRCSFRGECSRNLQTDKTSAALENHMQHLLH